MLEFQEGFFEQEIRDGFYLDATMKTVWAAELEVLQKVAEVCDKYNLTWYAACGTLLGAIRHEGFVPWDDDMDIWMLRKDYNKLMEVLPKELPEHYRVRSPLTEEGYDQFHTCVNSGSGVSIAKDWLEEFHGCPFTVGLDIFPLDYLPRNEEEREMQKRLFLLVGRMAQQAKETDRGNLEVEDEEDAEDAVAKSKADILEGIQYLEENFNLKINKQLVEDEQWYEASSELWKWANYIAMMYGEEDGDYLVEYVDYTKWEHKKFPKEWFAEVYSATFENFMLPIPAEYDKVLRIMYGDYMAYQRKTGMHEYPYYARQLKQLKEYVADVEARAGKAGITAIEDIEIIDKPLEIPEEWLPIVTKSDGSRKKIILMANDPAIYMAYGDVALDKLENALRQFKEAKEDVVLWWRPMPVMEKLLNTVSTSLAERYVSILNAFKAGGWAICDETDNTDRAVKQCDIYYGEMNAILQPFQNAGKAALIAHMGDVDYKASNEERIVEHKAYTSFSDYVEKSDEIYCANVNYNGLMILDKQVGRIEEWIPFEDEEAETKQLHFKCIEKKGKICFLPTGSGPAHIYDLRKKKQIKCELIERINVDPVSWNEHECDEQLYLLPCREEFGVWEWNVDRDSFKRQDWWKLSAGDKFLKHGKIDNNKFFTLPVFSNQLFVTDIIERKVQKYVLPDNEVVSIQYDGENFWYVRRGNLDIICWNQKHGILKQFVILRDLCKGNPDIMGYAGLCYVDNRLFFVLQNGTVYVLEEQEQQAYYLGSFQFDTQNVSIISMTPYFKVVDRKLVIMLQNMAEVMIVDLETISAKQKHQSIHLEKMTQEYRNQVLLKRNPLLYEDSELVDLSFLLSYCSDHK